MALKRKLTPEEKAQVLLLHSQGLSGPEIADQMNIDDARQVVGVIRAAVNFRRHPSMTPGTQPAGAPMTTPPPAPRTPETPAAPAMPPEASAVPAVAPVPVAAPVPTPVHAAPAPAAPVARPVHLSQARLEQRPAVAPQPAVVSQPAGQAAPDGFGSSWTPSAGHASGFNFQAPARKYMVYRDEPNDGLLGEHVDPFGEDKVAQIYGSGQYRVLRFEPGNPRPFQAQFRVSPSFGPPKFAARASQAAERPGYGRWSSQQRPWFRGTDAPREEDGVNEPQYNDRPRLYDFARHTPSSSASDATAAAAIKALGDLNSKALDQVEQARRQGPDTFMSKFFADQQAQWRESMEQQRRQDAERRREEEEKWERRQKEADREYQRRQEEEQKRHEREIEKLRLETESREKAREQERRALMEVEEKRLAVIREEAKIRQDALQQELQRNREEQRAREDRLEKQLSEIQQATSAQIQEHEEKLKGEMVRERELLERESKLKEKHLDKEHELQAKILDVKKEQLESQGTNEVFTVVNNLINKFSAGLKEVVDLKKIEATTNMAPEAQAAAVVHGMGKKEESAPEPAKAQAEKTGAQPAASGGKGAEGNGQAAPEAAGQQEERPMEEIVQQMVEQPFFKKVLKEWSLHVRTQQDATTFVNMYLEWMRDPNDHEGRKATTMFANFIAPRPWAELYKIIKPKLEADVIKIFDTPAAEEYYETFRSLVTEQIAAYWEQFAQEREAVKAARRAAGSSKVEEPAKK